MHAGEFSLLRHLDQIRSINIPEGGLTNMLLCSNVKSEVEMEAALEIHRSNFLPLFSHILF